MSDQPYIKPTAYVIELRPGGPWMDCNGEWTEILKERWVWYHPGHAEEALAHSLKIQAESIEIQNARAAAEVKVPAIARDE